MKEITKKEYYAIYKDYRGVWSREDYPQFIEKRTMLNNNEGGTELLIEGQDFKIT